MKPFIYTLLIVCLCSCTTYEATSVALTVLSDRTDAHIPAPKSDDIRYLLDLENTPNAEVTFKLQNIGNTDFNTTYTLKLEAHSLLGNGLQRQSDLKRFNKTLDTLIQRENTKPYDYHSSSIYLPLLERLTAVKSTEANRKMVVLYSDGFEFSDVYNIYDPNQQKQLFNNLSKVAEHFKKQHPIGDLTGVELYLIYLPKTNVQNRLYRQICQLYRNVFEGSGLTIYNGLDHPVTL